MQALDISIIIITILISTLIIVVQKLVRVNKLLKESSKIKSNENRLYDMIREGSMSDIVFGNNPYFHPITIEIYKRFIEVNGFHYFKESYPTIKVTLNDGNLEIWDNGSIHAEIHRCDDSILKRYNTSLPELNNSLTDLDRILLDRICQRFKEIRKGIVHKVFI